MILASQLKAGAAIRFEGHPYKVLIADYHSGQGKMGGSTHARLLNLDTGSLRDFSFRSDLKLEELTLERKPMDYLYGDETACHFMDPISCEQEEVPHSLVGGQARLLAAGMRVSIEFLGDRVVSVQLPDFLELTVDDTPPPAHSGGQDNTWKTARLENGMEVMVPQFIKTGDSIRVDTAQVKYMDRVKTAGR